MDMPVSLTRDIVLIGGGHTHALLLRQWGMNPLPGARLTVINPGPTAPYTGMLPGFVAGHYTRDDLDIDLVKLARFAGARLILGCVTGIDRDARLLNVPGRPPVAYDYASVDIGITSDMPEIPGFRDHAIAAKPLGAFSERWQAHLAGSRGPVAVIGGGIAGVELALAMRHALGARPDIHVIDRSTALAGVGDKAAIALRAAMKDTGVALIENAAVQKVTAATVELSGGQSVAADLTVGAAGARPYGWLEETGLTLHDGYIAVGADLRAVNDDRIFAVGDCAHLTAAPRPKAGVFAVRAAPVLTHNLKAIAAGRTLKPFKPQSHYLKLVSLGDKAALADKWGRALTGAWVWRWKDRIDRAFMDRLAKLPPMGRPLPDVRAMADDATTTPLCAGCGAKVGPDVLGTALSRLPTPTREDVLTGPGDDAAILAVGDAQLAITTDHLRAFCHDPWTFARITALHALGDLWAMGATPGTALMHLSLPDMSPDLQARSLAEMLDAAQSVFAETDTEIIGGHTSLGAEMTLGFTLTGTLVRPIPLGGAWPGDDLILTRPIGTGTLLAADMTGAADGNHIAAALTLMGTSQGDAARVLAQHAHAMTDVTGFGLAGHAHRMAKASNVTLALDLADIPILEGAIALAKAGHQSSLWPANRAVHKGPLPDTAEARLLFDPQTAGGFLAAVPPTASNGMLQAIRDAGHQAARIGRVIEASTYPVEIIAS